MKRTISAGLGLYCIAAALGLFLRPGLAERLLVSWLAGFLFLAFALSYTALFVKDRSPRLYFSFIVLLTIGLNFLIQRSGGAGSPLLSLYFLVTTAAAFRHRNWAYPVAGLILVIEAMNLLLTGHADSLRWYVFSGFAASLAGVAFLTSHVTHRIKSEAKWARDSYEKLLSDADAVDPLAGGTNVEALAGERRQATNVSVARERESAFGEMFDIIAGFVPAHTYALFLNDRDDGILTLRGVRSRNNAIPSGAVELAWGSGLIGICAARKQPQYLPYMVIPAKSLGYYSRELPVKSFLAVPIMQGEHISGVLAVDSLENDAFPSELQDMLVRFSPFFSQIIEKYRISLEMDIRAKNFAALHEMSSVLSSSLDISEVFEKLAVRLQSVVPYDYCAFLLYDETTNEASFSTLRGYDARFSGKRFSLEQSVILSHIKNEWGYGRIVSIHYPDLGDRGREIGLFPLKELRKPLKSLYGRPLVARNKFIGAAFLAAVRPRAFTEYHRNFMDTLLNQASMVADNSMLHKNIMDIARTDGLTGLLNHRTFMEKLAVEYKRIDREPRPFSILLMDIDKFKNVNDKYGHPVGDVAIRTVAGALKETARGSDFVARYGGEEFAVGMVDTDSKGAFRMGERIRKLLEKTLVTRVPDGELRVTVSIGVSSFPEDTKDVADLVTFADNALYQAKRSGRNRVCLHRDVEPVTSGA
ncbi:MAG TPA: diguanylate cyclase [Nitrospirota bacterium]|nr:diguanylate cyclase [Nitrospirota bacterium]